MDPHKTLETLAGICYRFPMRRLLALAVILAASGCVTVPKESAILSAELGASIGEAERSHLALVTDYADQRRGRAEDFLRYRWTPGFIAPFLERIDFKNEVCRIEGQLDRAIVVQDLVEDISAQVEARRRTLMTAIDEIERDLRRAVGDHYAQARRMNDAVTSNLRSAAKGHALEKDIRAAIMRPINKVVPISAANKKLDKMLEWVE